MLPQHLHMNWFHMTMITFSRTSLTSFDGDCTILSDNRHSLRNKEYSLYEDVPHIIPPINRMKCPINQSISQ
jgi:hypothetical protein